MTASSQKARIADAFGSANAYDDHALIQGRVAKVLADQIATLPIFAIRRSEVRLLEIGCGTGLLTRALQARQLPGKWLVTDIAPSMLVRCIEATSRQSGPATLKFATMDGEHPVTMAGFDIICSSLAFQWFCDLAGALQRLCANLAPGGVLSFTTLLAGTHGEWECAQTEQGFPPAGLQYPDMEGLAALFPAGGMLTMSETTLRQQHPDSRAFLRSLKLIGAGTPALGRRQLSVGAMRRIMAAYDVAGASSTYRIAICTWTKLKIDKGSQFQ